MRIKLGKNISELREAAKKHQWLECENILPVLLQNLNPKDMIKLTAAYVARFLPIFEKHHPEVTWPRKALDILARDGQTDESVEFRLNDESPIHTVDIFFRAISYVDNASERQDNPKSCAIASANAIFCIITAFQLDYGLANFPSAWKIAPKTILEEHEPDTLMYLGNPEVENYIETLWSNLADEIAIR